MVVSTVGAIAAVVLAVTVAANGPQTLAGSEWRPVEIAGQPIADDAKMFIRFEVGGKVQAHGGCNRMGGGYSVDKASLSVGPLMSTRMGCAPEIMALESVFAKALTDARLFLRDGTKLTLKTAQGVTTMRLRQSDWD